MLSEFKESQAKAVAAASAPPSQLGIRSSSATDRLAGSSVKARQLAASGELKNV